MNRKIHRYLGSKTVADFAAITIEFEYYHQGKVENYSVSRLWKNDDGKIISFHLFEVYKDTVALDFHRNTSYYKNYRSKVVNLLDRPIEVKVLNSIDSI